MQCMQMLRCAAKKCFCANVQCNITRKLVLPPYPCFSLFTPARHTTLCPSFHLTRLEPRLKFSIPNLPSLTLRIHSSISSFRHLSSSPPLFPHSGHLPQRPQRQTRSRFVINPVPNREPPRQIIRFQCVQRNQRWIQCRHPFTGR